jgi:hypothetical protein
MADGDIRIWRHTGYLSTDHSGAPGGEQLVLSPTVPSIVDNEHWTVQAKVWRTMRSIANLATGPYMKSFEQWMNVQDNGTTLTYEAGSVVVLKNATVFLGSESTDTISLDYVGGLRLWGVAADAQVRDWYAEVTIYVGTGGMTIGT